MTIKMVLQKKEKRWMSVNVHTTGGQRGKCKEYAVRMSSFIKLQGPTFVYGVTALGAFLLTYAGTF